MWRPGRRTSPVQTAAAGPTFLGFKRDRLAWLVALASLICVATMLLFTKGMQVLMPGPLTSLHGAIETCSSCHSNSGNGKLGWVHGLVAGDPIADSKACLTCHKMPETAFNAHGASRDVLKRSTERLLKIAASTPAPLAAQVQDSAFPTHDIMAQNLACATCHQEHKGTNFKLGAISNAQCRACHVVKFDSFDGNHPTFDSYPFKRRTRIIYDHAEHFRKHYPEVAKKEPDKRIPETCATCHDSPDDKRVMSVVSFDKTCSGCHRDQITGKERASGPKGVAFLSVPGLDVQTLQAKNAPIGEWPDGSEAKLTPFMKVMIGRNARGNALLETVERLNLQDLSKASDADIKAVSELVWEVKGLFHALIKGKASDVLGDLNVGGDAKLSPGLVADLTASLPRDVVVSAQQEWLPNLGAEMAKRPEPDKRSQSGWSTEGAEKKLAATVSRSELSVLEVARRDDAVRLAQSAAPDTKDPAPDAQGRARVPLPSGTPRSIGTRKTEGEAGTGSGGGGASTSGPGTSKTDEKKAGGASPSPPDAAKTDAAAPKADGGPQTDDLLHPTEDELRAMKADGKGTPAIEAGAATAAKPDDPASPAGPQPASGDGETSGQAASASPTRRPSAVISIGSDVDPESWAEYGGWYRQDYAIFYRPAGHKDKFIYSWLFLTGPQAPRNAKTPAAAVFDSLTGKEAQGACTKCHSVDDIPGKGRLVNFSPVTAASKQGRFTAFIHEPHFGLMENKGCLTCHSLESGRPYLKSYEHGDPHAFAANFGEVKKDLCQGCHNSTMAQQDCGLCHKYHVNGIVTPIITTKLPAQ